MEKETIGFVVGLVSVAVGLAGIGATLLLRQARKSTSVEADRAAAAGRDQTVSGAVVTGDRAGPVIVAQPGATVNVYYDGLPQAEPKVRDPFEEGRRLQRADQHEAAIGEFEKAFAAAENDGQRCALHILVGNSFFRLSRLPQAEGRYREALVLARRANDREGKATALSNLGIVYAQSGELDKAEEHLKKALTIHQETGYRLGQAANLGNLGNVYYERGELGKTEEYLLKALAIDEEIHNHLGQANSLGNLGRVYLRRGELEKAEEHCKKALAINEEIGSRLDEATDLCNLGNVYHQRGELDRAEEHCKKALAIFDAVGNRLGQADTLGNLGVLAEQRSDPERARGLLNRAKALYEAIGAGGEGPELVREALERLGPASPPEPKRKRARKKAPPKKP